MSDLPESGSEADPTNRDEDGDGPGTPHSSTEFDAADDNHNRCHDLAEFSAFVRSREEGEHTDEELQKRFAALETSLDSSLEMREFLTWSLREALTRSSQRVVDLFKQWDEDNSGSVDRREFHRAIRALGFDVTQAESDDVFGSLDENGSGKVEYKELHAMLRASSGSEGTKANLARGASRISQGDYSKMGKLTAKNVNQNYRSARVSVLPPTVKLELHPDMSMQEQIVEILKQHSIKLVSLFNEWDDDANGALNKKELRQGIAALGYEVPKKEVDELFESFNTNEDGAGFKDNFIEFEEFKRVLSERGSKLATRAKLTKQKSELRASTSSAPMSEEDRAAVKLQAIQRGQLTRKGNLKKPSAHAHGEGGSEGGAVIGAEATDVQGSGEEGFDPNPNPNPNPGTGEEGFDPSMRHNWIDFDLTDVTQHRRLNADEFNSWVRFREEGEHADADLEQRFLSMEIDQDGRIDPHEYLQWSLRDALLRSSGRVVDVFKSWDADRSGNVDKKEFWRAVCALGFDVPQPDVDAVFDTLDGDRSGKLEYKELHAMLRDSQASPLSSLPSSD